ncbi:MAG: S41 family peptidase [Planctomycetota bacterium]|nr:S41 family peptidase [Planctomycetota bacterium]MEE2894711.1 S41 family peptidase [Planctomycetota bacterium]
MSPRSTLESCLALAATAALVLGGWGCEATGSKTAAEAGPGGPPPKAYETFDMVWELVDTRHFDPDHNGVDWVAVRQEYRPLVADTRSDRDLQVLLSRMLDELGQTHFVIIPESVTPAPRESEAEAGSDANEADDAPGAGTTGLRLEWFGDEPIVAEVDPGSEADAAGIRPGWLVLEVDGRSPSDVLGDFHRAAIESGSPFARYESLARLNGMASRPVGDVARFRFVDGSGTEIERELAFAAERGERATFGLLPSTATRVDLRILTPAELAAFGIEGADDLRIAHLRFNIWLFPILVPIAEAVDEHRDVDGFIIDLRGNPGGIGGLSMGVAGHFMAEPESLGDMKMRDATMHFTVNPQRATPDGRLVDPFAGPLAIILDGASASTSEVFAAGLQQLDRATVVGRASAGAALPAHFSTLPNGDGFMFAVADFLGPAGTSIEGAGVVPDIEVPIDRNLLLEEGEPDVAAAARWIAGELRDQSS